jgi:site-specific DNA-methyltransferase (adenine-specific)
VAFRTNTLLQGDCLKRFGKIGDGCIDLVFADPPFNIGYNYDVYQDRRARSEYLDWCRDWIVEIRRILKPSGSFWLAIGDEFAAELKLIAQDDAGFAYRSWIIWYYTFGVNCVRGFSRSHTHLFHFVSDPDDFTFNGENPAIRVPSARQLVYADSRANPKGRLPDNTWIYRPQDAPQGSFAPMHDTWYFSRVAGTFNEREGFHGCQMPEQLLGRIIRVSSNPRDIVLDPFSGSGTTLAVAKKLGRQWLGFELSRDYTTRIRERLAKTSVGDKLDGPVDPMRSAPRTKQGKSRGRVRNGRLVPQLDDDTERGIVAAYREKCGGESTDFVLCNPEAAADFVQACKSKGLPGNAYAWNRLLLRIRKSGKLPRTRNRTRRLTFAAMDPYSFASEIAMQTLAIDYQLTLDEMLCAPDYAAQFDRVAAEFAPSFSSFEYRWAALAIRKRAKQSKSLAQNQFTDWLDKDLPKSVALDRLANRTSPSSGVYVLTKEGNQPLYVGEAMNVSRRIRQIQDAAPWQQLGVTGMIFLPIEHRVQHGLQSALIHKTDAFLNSDLLRPNFDSGD